MSSQLPSRRPTIGQVLDSPDSYPEHADSIERVRANARHVLEFWRPELESTVKRWQRFNQVLGPVYQKAVRHLSGRKVRVSESTARTRIVDAALTNQPQKRSPGT